VPILGFAAEKSAQQQKWAVAVAGGGALQSLRALLLAPELAVYGQHPCL
jgi:hypothetical protein